MGLDGQASCAQAAGAATRAEVMAVAAALASRVRRFMGVSDRSGQ